MIATIEDLWNSTVTESSLIGLVTLIILTFSLSLVGAILILRHIKSQTIRRKDGLCAGFQRILNKIIVNESYSTSDVADAAFEFYMAELRLLTGNSKFSRELLSTHLIHVKKNLTGSSAEALEATYRALMLYNESIAKLKSLRWQRKVQGIREVAEMNCQRAVPLVEKLLYSKHQIVREEALIALVRLEEKPLAFLHHFKGYLSPWMRINITRHLERLDPRCLPVFSDFFYQSNLSVQLFSMSMARRFQQQASAHGLADMLYSPNPKVVGLAISALGDLEAHQYREQLAKVIMHMWSYEKLAQKIIRTFSRIGHMEKDAPLLAKFLAHPSYDVRFETVSALLQFGQAGKIQLDMAGKNGNAALNKIIGHLSEPLLS